jgi:hypothetical protein
MYSSQPLVSCTYGTFSLFFQHVQKTDNATYGDVCQQQIIGCLLAWFGCKWQQKLKGVAIAFDSVLRHIPYSD